MARHCADHERVALSADARQLRHASQINELTRVGQAQFHRGQQRLAAGQGLRARCGQAGGIGQHGRALIGKAVHVLFSYCFQALAC
jgi:hypothetical protein